MWSKMMTKLEQFICKKFGSKYGVFTGNGTTAMYLAFRALALQEKKVIFPAVSCTNPVNSAIFAGYQVDFCDIRLKDYTIDVLLLEQMLNTGNYGIVVPTHIYGHRYDEKAIRQLCDKYNVVLLEDAAQSFQVGDADVSVMSFGHTKVCDTQLGGGIAFTQNKNLEEKMRLEKKLLTKTEGISYVLFDEYREKYYDIIREECRWEKRNQRLKKLQLESKAYFLFDLDDNTEINKELLKLEEKVDERRKKAELYQKYLLDTCVIKPYVNDMFRWRYTFLYKGNREILLKEARERGIDISSWYYSLAGIYKNEHMRNADLLEEKVVNLWVDETHTYKQIREEIDILNMIMGEDCFG